MGQAKRAWMEEEERGWSAPDGHVCRKCVDDDYLKRVIARHQSSRTCDYCGRTGRRNIAAPVETLMPVVASAAFYSFNDPTQAGIPWDEGPLYRGVSTEDMLMSLPFHCHEELFEEVAGAFRIDEWVRSAGGHWSSSHDHEVFGDSWHSFVAAIKHQTRFHFYQAASDVAGPQELGPGMILEAIGRMVHRLSLVTTIGEGTALYRARVREVNSSWVPDASTMGAPPSDRARAGRMNPAGISYLYCAIDEATALGETVSGPPVEVAIGRFASTMPLTVLSLCDLPPFPSIFDEGARSTLEVLKFLEAFIAEISMPVKKDGSEHIDYLPSQVVSEWFAQVFQPSREVSRLDGILYPSAVVEGGRNLVLFPSERGVRRAFDMVEFRGALVESLENWKSVFRAIHPAQAGKVR